MTAAFALIQKSLLHTVPQCPPRQTSTLPLSSLDPPISRRSVPLHSAGGANKYRIQRKIKDESIYQRRQHTTNCIPFRLSSINSHVTYQRILLTNKCTNWILVPQVMLACFIVNAITYSLTLTEQYIVINHTL